MWTLTFSALILNKKWITNMRGHDCLKKRKLKINPAHQIGEKPPNGIISLNMTHIQEIIKQIKLKL